MGTNFYLHTKPDCEHCGAKSEPLHIGKSSGGWCFSLHVIPEMGINTLDDWRKLWLEPGTRIEDEYGRDIGPDEMESIISKRHGGMSFDEMRWYGVGYTGEADFHRRNYSMRGPNNLLRHRLGDHCVGHGEGTWDYIVGDFS